MTRFSAEVLDRRQLTPNMVRIVLGGEGLSGFTSTGQPDEAVLLTLPLHEPDDCRWYTVRAVSAGSTPAITVDVALHEEGIATTWARSAPLGERIGVSEPKAWFKAPTEWTSLVLVGDLTALPAIGRILDEAPAGMRIRAVIETPHPDDRLPLTSAADVEIAWIDNPDQSHGTSRLPEALGSIPTATEGEYVWIAAEAAACRAMRKDLRHNRGLPSSAYSILGYWRPRAEEWLAKYEALPVDLASLWEEAEKPGVDSARIEDEIEAILERAGL